MTKQPLEEVVLVSPDDQVFGLALKQIVHQNQTPLHRAFSLFLLNRLGQLLVQQRSSDKRTWPLVWSNSCCGHPAYGESFEQAICRRLQVELGVMAKNIQKIANYQYQFVRDGVMENEICPIFVGLLDQEPRPNPDEVEAVNWLEWRDFLQIKDSPQKANFSEWSLEEAEILNQSPDFQVFYQNIIQ